MTATAVETPPATEERGTTVIADRVVERIAARAAQESGHVTGPGGVRAGVRGLTGRTDEPRASADVDGRIAILRIALGVIYPAPVAATTQAVRTTVRTRVEELTGLTVRQIDIDVTRLPTPAEGPRSLR